MIDDFNGNVLAIEIDFSLPSERFIRTFNEIVEWSTSALVPELRHEVFQVMQTLATEEMATVVVTHEMDFARSVGTRLVFMVNAAISGYSPRCKFATEAIFLPPVLSRNRVL